MPKIRIILKETWGARIRTELFLDGESLGFIYTGENKEIDVSAGQHSLQAKIAKHSGKAFNFNAFNKEIKSLTVFTNKIADIFLPIAVLNFGLLAFLVFGNLKSKHTYFTCSMVFFLILILSFYFLVVRRNRYFIIKEN